MVESETKVVAITGITGFLGNNLNNYLKDEFEILGIGRKTTVSYKDLQNYKYDCLIHLAGLAHDTSVGALENYNKINYELTREVFDDFLKSSAQIFIYVSSVKAVADSIDEILDESTNRNPSTNYGISKKNAEEYILANIPKNKRVFILRPCMIHGYGNKGNLSSLYSFLRLGFPYPFGSYENKRSFLSISNFCFIIKSIIQNSAIQFGVYCLADDESISTNELVEIMRKEMGKETKIWYVSPFIIKIFVMSISIFGQSRLTDIYYKLTENFVVSNLKIKKDFNLHLPYSVTEGLKLTIKTLMK